MQTGDYYGIHKSLCYSFKNGYYGGNNDYRNTSKGGYNKKKKTFKELKECKPFDVLQLDAKRIADLEERGLIEVKEEKPVTPKRSKKQ